MSTMDDAFREHEEELARRQSEYDESVRNQEARRREQESLGPCALRPSWLSPGILNATEYGRMAR